MTVAHLTDQDKAALAERFIDVPWCVYAPALGQIHHCEHANIAAQHPGGQCPDPFDAARAIAYTDDVRRRLRELAELPGVTVREVTLFVLHYGVVWTYR